MRTYLFTFTYAGQTVEYRIMARNKQVANTLARARARAWRSAIDAMSATQGATPWRP